jgi:ribosome-associated translation inhibitor RaiA
MAAFPAMLPSKRIRISRYSADSTMHLDTGMTLQATGQAQDPQLAFEAGADRLEKRLRRYKRRLKSHIRATPASKSSTCPTRIVAPVAGR